MKLRSIAAILVFSAVPALSGPQEDANYIVSQTFTEEMFRGAISAQRKVLISAIQNDMRRHGIELKKPERFFDLFLEAFIDEFTEGMRAEAATLYVDLFTPEELEGIAAFLRTEAGQGLIRKTPALMQQSSMLGQRIGMMAGVRAGPRLAEQIREEDILAPDDKPLRERLIDMLE